MADYLLMILEDEHAHAQQSPKAMAELIAARARFAESLRGRGQLLDFGRFRPSKDGKRVRRDGDRLHVENGPLAENGKALGAYYWVRAPNSAEAADIGRECPTLPNDQVDVRPLMKGHIDAEKIAKSGKIFAFVVRGSGATSKEWEQVMDRIDAETSGCFPPDSFLGGVRLRPPQAEQQSGSRGDRQATLDGPFLECKEVIGGLFIMRTTSAEDAVQWAGESRFVVHGSLEVRELWRS